jgi:hypothetical protein
MEKEGETKRIEKEGERKEDREMDELNNNIDP